MTSKQESFSYVNGINSISQCLARQAGFIKTESPYIRHKITDLYVMKEKESDRINNILVNSKKYNVKVHKIYEREFNQLLKEARIDNADGYHQGMIAKVVDINPLPFQDVKIDKLNSMFVVLDGITDPHNLGAIIRTAAFYGCSGVLVPEDKSAKFSASVFKVASGGFEFVPLFYVANLPKTVAILKQFGKTIIGLSEHSDKELSLTAGSIDLSSTALVIGSEQSGIRPAIKSICDNWLKLEGVNKLSLNASVAFSIAATRLFEAKK